MQMQLECGQEEEKVNHHSMTLKTNGIDDLKVIIIGDVSISLVLFHGNELVFFLDLLGLLDLETLNGLVDGYAEEVLASCWSAGCIEGVEDSLVTVGSVGFLDGFI